MKIDKKNCFKIKKYSKNTDTEKSYKSVRLFIKFLIIFALIFCLGPHSVSAAEFAPGTIKTIDPGGVIRYIEIDGDHIVWTEYKKVILHTLSTNKSLKISGGNYFELYPPEISGDHVIWLEKDDSAADSRIWDLYICTISSGERKLIPTEKGYPRYPDVSGDIAVWIEDNEVFLFNITEWSLKKISEELLFAGDCSIDGDTVAWEGTKNADSRTTDLYVYNIITKKTDIITDLPGFRDGFLLCEGKVIWADSLTESSKSVVRVYDIKSGDLSEITSVSDQAGGFGLSVDLFVYTNFGFWSTDTPDSQNHLINLTTGEDMLLSLPETGSKGASISGNNIVWREEDVVLFTYDPSGEPFMQESIVSDIPFSKEIPGFTFFVTVLAVLFVFAAGKFR